MLNYWRTASTELTALAPRVPFIGKKGTFKTDARKWASINSANHAVVEYDGETPPQRQPLDSGRSVGAIQEALNAQDDMKSVLGLYDPSLGMVEGGKQSGRAILALQQQGATSNFHYMDNLARAIQHAGRIIIDLIPKVYSGQRMVRILGMDGRAENVQLGGPMVVKGPDGKPQADPQTGLPMTKICDVSAGKYDLTVEVGPSYGSKRQEAADQMTQLIQAFPQAAPVIGDLVAKNLDWPDHEEVARRLHALLPPQLQAADGDAPQNPLQSPAVQQVIQQGHAVIQQQGQALQQTQAQLAEATQALAQAKQANDLKARELDIKAFEAQTARLDAVARASQPASFGPAQ